MVAKMVQNHVQAAQQKEMTEEDHHRPSEAQAQEEEPKGKGLSKLVTKKITWKAEVKEPEGRSTSPQLEALTQENDQLKKTIKRIRSIMEKRDKGVEAITTKIQEARVKVEVAIKEWGKEEDELAGFLNKVHKEVEETMVQEGWQDDLEEEEDNLQDVVSLVGDTEYELFEGEIPDEVKQFIAHNKEGDTLGHEISMLEVTSPPRISQKHNGKIIGAMAYVLRRPEQYQMVSFSGWTPIGGLFKAMTDGNAFKGITCTVDVAVLTQVGLFASTQGGDKILFDPEPQRRLVDQGKAQSRRGGGRGPLQKGGTGRRGRKRRAMGRDDGRWQKKQDGGRGRKAVETSQGESLERQRLALELSRWQDKGRCNSLCTEKTPEDQGQRFHWLRGQKVTVKEKTLNPPGCTDQKQVSRWWIDRDDLFPGCHEKDNNISKIRMEQHEGSTPQREQGEEG